MALAWKAGWVHALTSSNLVSSATRITSSRAPVSAPGFGLSRRIARLTQVHRPSRDPPAHPTARLERQPQVRPPAFPRKRQPYGRPPALQRKHSTTRQAPPRPHPGSPAFPHSTSPPVICWPSRANASPTAVRQRYSASVRPQDKRSAIGQALGVTRVPWTIPGDPRPPGPR